MHQLMSQWSLPWYIYVGVGIFLALFLFKPAFQKECDKMLARMLSMKPKKVASKDK